MGTTRPIVKGICTMSQNNLSCKLGVKSTLTVLHKHMLQTQLWHMPAIRLQLARVCPLKLSLRLVYNAKQLMEMLLAQRSLDSVRNHICFLCIGLWLDWFWNLNSRLDLLHQKINTSGCNCCCDRCEGLTGKAQAQICCVSPAHSSAQKVSKSCW